MRPGCNPKPQTEHGCCDGFLPTRSFCTVLCLHHDVLSHRGPEDVNVSPSTGVRVAQMLMFHRPLGWEPHHTFVIVSARIRPPTDSIYCQLPPFVPLTQWEKYSPAGSGLSVRADQEMLAKHSGPGKILPQSPCCQIQIFLNPINICLVCLETGMVVMADKMFSALPY